jgi:putative membrane protein
MKNHKKILGAIAVLICIGLALSSTFLYFSRTSTVYGDTKIDEDIKKSKKDIEKAYPSLLKSNGGNKDKIETTYAIMDMDGNLDKVIVTEQLSNNKKDKELKDLSNLENIENTSGDEEYSRDGDKITWHTKGNKIQYQGIATKDLPVKVKVSYYLEGEQKTAKEIAGKAGKVKIRFDYDIPKEDLIEGKTYRHPYTMASGLILDNTHFSDIKVTGGKTVDNGNSTLAFGIAFPFMNENLGLDKSKINIPSSVEVSAYTDKFNISGTYSIALSGVFNDIDTSEADNAEAKIGELKKALNLLSDSSKKLLTGADDLSNGALALNDGIQDLNRGVGSLQEGSNSLVDGSEELSRGLGALSANSPQINQGIRQMEASIFQNASVQMRAQVKNNSITLTPQNYIKVIQGISDSALTLAEQELRKGLEDQGLTDVNIQNQVLSVAYNDLMAQAKSEPSPEDIEIAIKNAGLQAQKAAFVQTAIGKNQAFAKQILQLKGYGDDQITPELIAVLSVAIELAEANPMAIEAKIPEATEYVKAAAAFKNGELNAAENVHKLAAMALGKETPKKLADLKNQLDQVEALVSGVLQYTGGLDAAAIGSQKLTQGMNELNNGIAGLKNGCGSLAEGSKKLIAGLDTLQSGMAKFNKDGIEAFVNELNNEELTDIFDNFKAITEASKNEVFIGGKTDEMSGESRIIFKTGEIK